jgi:hypothetical protein
MKLGSQTGSVMNHLAARGVIGQPSPHIGMGATILHWTDRSPASIIAVIKRKDDRIYLEVQEDNYKFISGSAQSESQEYEYSPNPNGSIRTFRQEPNGMWQEVVAGKRPGTFKKASGGGCGLRIGERERYYDPSF